MTICAKFHIVFDHFHADLQICIWRILGSSLSVNFRFVLTALLLQRQLTTLKQAALWQYYLEIHFHNI